MEPATSPFIMILRSLTLPFCISENNSESEICFLSFMRSSRIAIWRWVAISRATFSEVTTLSLSPACGTSSRPVISTGVEGIALAIFSPRALAMLLTLPHVQPTITGSPTCRVPFWINMVATGPKPLSSLDSITAPTAFLVGSALSERISDTRRIISSRPSILMRCLAETSTQTVSPPQSSGTRPCSASCFLTLSILAPGLSILFMATIMGISAAIAWSIASIVWGWTPSSAETTRMAISVTLEPWARI